MSSPLTWAYTGGMTTPQSTKADREGVVWACVAGIAIIAVSGLLVAVRDTIGNTNVALMLVVFVVAAAVVGGRLAGVTAAVIAALSFNFFHTEPYLTLRVKEGEDIVTVVLLVVVGLAVGELALLSQRRRTEVSSRPRAPIGSSGHWPCWPERPAWMRPGPWCGPAWPTSSVRRIRTSCPRRPLPTPRS